MKITLETCSGHYDTNEDRFNFRCGSKGYSFKPNAFTTWLKDKRKIKKSIIITLGTK